MSIRPRRKLTRYVICLPVTTPSTSTSSSHLPTFAFKRCRSRRLSLRFSRGSRPTLLRLCARSSARWFASLPKPQRYARRPSLGAFALISLVVGGSLIYNTFGVPVAQRTRELALLRALGATSRQVFASVVGEAAIIGLGASAVGLGLGFGAEALLRALLRLLDFPLLSGSGSTSLTSLGLPVLLGTVVTIAAGLVPARGLTS